LLIEDYAYEFSWITKDVYDSDKQAGGDQRVILVDVGGGKGQILRSILEENTHIPPNRCVLEDQSDQAVHADATGVLSTVKRQVASFFQEQPVKGELSQQEKSMCKDSVATTDCP
jgi:hypothetical protein